MHEKEIEINTLFLQQMPEIMYHGSTGKNYTIHNFKEKIKIFNTLDEYIEYERTIKKNQSTSYLNSKGRTNLDAAFHGIYFTPSYDSAYKWASKKLNSKGQVVVIKVNKEKLFMLNGISYCFPNIEWANFIINNRKHSNVQNKYDYSYSLIADGQMINLLPKIEKVNDSNINEIYLELIPKIIKKNIVHNILIFNYEDFINSYLSNNLLNFQLCFSHMNCLNCFEVIDIINLDKGVYNEK